MSEISSATPAGYGERLAQLKQRIRSIGRSAQGPKEMVFA